MFLKPNFCRTTLGSLFVLMAFAAIRAEVAGQTTQAKSPTPVANSKQNNVPHTKGMLTYTKDIAPIFNQNCVACHRSGEAAPFTLLSYADAKKRAEQIALVTQKRVMPPWKLNSHGEFQDERRLTDAQIAVVKQWVSEGANEGRKSDIPPAPKFAAGWTLGQPDMTVQAPADYHLASEGRDVYRCFVIPTHFDEDRYVSAMDVRPGNRAVVHHVLAYIDGGGRARKLDGKDSEPGYSTGGGIGFMPDGMLGGWAPGARPIRLPVETGILLPKGADIVLEVHYHKDGKPETDRSQVALYFNKQPIERPFHLLPLLNVGIQIPAGDKDHIERAGVPVPLDAKLYTVFPHMHNLGRQMTVTATLPDGTKKQLVDVPDWDFNWQGFYAYKEPVKLPKGAKIELVAHYDNSTDNPRNPNSPPKTVRWGEQTTDEMCLCYLGFTLDAEQAPQRHASVSGAAHGSNPSRAADSKANNYKIDSAKNPEKPQQK